MMKCLSHTHFLVLISNSWPMVMPETQAHQREYIYMPVSILYRDDNGLFNHPQSGNSS